MLQLEVLIFELVAIDGLATSAIVVGEITTLAHELRNDTVEGGALVTESALARAQGPEVLSCAGHHISSQLPLHKRIQHKVNISCQATGAHKKRKEMLTLRKPLPMADKPDHMILKQGIVTSKK